MPSVILEATACGTSVLVTPVGAILTWLRMVTLVLTRVNGPKHIANGIIALLSKPEILEKVSKNAYKYVRENFSYEKTFEAWRKIFKQLEPA